jgi:hypothetical protein
MRKLEMVEYLPEYSLPGVYFRLGEYVADFGTSKEAIGYYQKVLDSKLTAIDDEEIHRHYTMFNVMAQSELEKLEPKPAKTDCWVASELYGPASQEVQVLRCWRDSVLSRRTLGRWFIACYYRTGPAIAMTIKKCQPLGAVLRVLIVGPCVALCSHLLIGGKEGRYE